MSIQKSSIMFSLMQIDIHNKLPQGKKRKIQEGKSSHWTPFHFFVDK